jgi:hypothetical protein
MKKPAAVAWLVVSAKAAAARKYRLPDFSNWKNPAAFARAFARLEKALRTSLR